MTIYVVEGSTGEYSDHCEWLFKAYRSEARAQAEVLRLAEAARLYHLGLDYADPDYVLRYDSRGGKAELLARFHIDDPKFQHDYTGTKYTYYAVELEEQ